MQNGFVREGEHNKCTAGGAVNGASGDAWLSGMIALSAGLPNSFLYAFYTHMYIDLLYILFLAEQVLRVKYSGMGVLPGGEKRLAAKL